MACNLTDLRRHLIVHSNEQPYHCCACDFKSKWKADVKKHQRSASHAGPILVGKKAMQKVIESLGLDRTSMVSLYGPNIQVIDNKQCKSNEKLIDEDNLEFKQKSSVQAKQANLKLQLKRNDAASQFIKQSGLKRKRHDDENGDNDDQEDEEEDIYEPLNEDDDEEELVDVDVDVDEEYEELNEEYDDAHQEANSHIYDDFNEENNFETEQEENNHHIVDFSDNEIDLNEHEQPMSKINDPNDEENEEEELELDDY